jgi:hypothetical protein
MEVTIFSIDIGHPRNMFKFPVAIEDRLTFESSYDH